MITIKHLPRVLVALLLALMVCGPAAAVTIVSWSSADTDNGPAANDFDTGTLLFPPIFAGSVSFDDPGGAYYHDADIVLFQVRSGGEWQTIYSDSSVSDCEDGAGDGGDVFLSSLSPPIQFSPRQIDGFRFTWGGACAGDNTYHDFNDSQGFAIRLNDGPRVIPTLGETAMILMALGLLMTGVFAGRKYLLKT